MSPVTTGSSQQHCAEADGASSVTPLPFVINATDVTISNYSRDEVGVHLHSPIAMYGTGYVGFGPSVLSYQDFDGESNGIQHAFSRPVPVNQVTVQCWNEDFTCCVQIDIIGIQ